MGTRIAIVGGGSTHWAPRLINDFAGTESLQDAEVTLMDIDSGTLPAMLDVAAHICKHRNVGLSARGTTDLSDALDGAQFVITAFSVGGFQSMKHDIEIPYRYGIRQPVGDTIGPGGINRAFRSIPVVLDLARQMERHCPEALLLNVTNPLTVLTRVVTKETSIRAAGLCNEVVGQKFVLSLLLGEDMRRIDPVVAGVNHLPLMVSLKVGGRDGFELIRDAVANLDGLGSKGVWMAPPAGMHYRKRSQGPDWTRADIAANNQIKLTLFDRFGVLPGSSDTHVSEFFPWFVTAASDFGRDWGVHHYGISGHEADKRTDDLEVAELLASEQISTWPSGELVAPLIDGILSDAGIALPMNLPNTGQVKNLPDDVVVECIGIADRRGLVARDSVSVPSVLGEQLRRIVASQELTIEAALTGNRALALQAVLADPVAGHLPFEQAESMTEELLEATASWLPRFFPS